MGWSRLCMVTTASVKGVDEVGWLCMVAWRSAKEAAPDRLGHVLLSMPMDRNCLAPGPWGGFS
eukprot:scaffold663496_cov59-Prasinocladus_malaysianus.AAC.1